MSPFVVAMAWGAGLWMVYLSLAGVNPPRRRPSRLQPWLEEAGVQGVTPVRFCAVCLIVGLATAFVVAAVTGVLSVAAVAGAGAAMVPPLVIGGRRRRRRRAFREAWPEAVDLIASAIRAGDSLQQAVAGLSERGPDALRPHFAALAASYRASGEFDATVASLRRTLADPIADRVCSTLVLARGVGGREIGRVLRTLSAFLRSDLRVRAEIEARQSWTVLAARVAAGAPWLVLLLMGTRRGALRAYDSPAGILILMVGAAVTFVGYRLMVAIGRLPDEDRWG